VRAGAARTHAGALFFLWGLTLSSSLAAANNPVFDEQERSRISSLSPLPPPPVDPSNRFSNDPRAIAFGRQLFFDPRLSLKGDRSCASCHREKSGWTDGQPVSTPKERFPRNVPTLFNTAFNRWFNWDGGADSAWAQALRPIETPAEMGLDRLTLVHRIASSPDLLESYEDAFGPLPIRREALAELPSAGRPVPGDSQDRLNLAWRQVPRPSQRVLNQIFANVGKAIAAFERTLTSGPTRFDRFVVDLLADHPSESLTRSELRGLKLFVGRGNCILCHSGPNLSDGEFHDLGLAVNMHGRVDPGRYGAVKRLLRDPFNQDGPYSDRGDGVAPVRFLKLTGAQLAQFKTPSLRQLALTGPYMHDGRFATLREVVLFYSERDKARPLEHASNLIKPLHLDEREVDDLVAFLRTLSGPVGPSALPRRGRSRSD